MKGSFFLSVCKSLRYFLLKCGEIKCAQQRTILSPLTFTAYDGASRHDKLGMFLSDFFTLNEQEHDLIWPFLACLWIEHSELFFCVF